MAGLYFGSMMADGGGSGRMTREVGIDGRWRERQKNNSNAIGVDIDY
jgi:hypothetical protein